MKLPNKNFCWTTNETNLCLPTWRKTLFFLTGSTKLTESIYPAEFLVPFKSQNSAGSDGNSSAVS
jgi:hypothetical protein